ncbi:MAG: hypothetical protein KGO96_07165 [Elusimicrobia bacterium]|nr:hypothetical protein [Elusimicrobiota bacterium]
MSKSPLIKELAKDRLLEEMYNFSQEYWCASWLHDIEYVIWDLIINPPETDEEFLKTRFNPGQVNYMADLADICEGWWTWDKEPKFVDLKEWDKIYRKWIQDSDTLDEANYGSKNEND